MKRVARIAFFILATALLGMTFSLPAVNAAYRYQQVTTVDFVVEAVLPDGGFLSDTQRLDCTEASMQVIWGTADGRTDNYPGILVDKVVNILDIGDYPRRFIEAFRGEDPAGKCLILFKDVSLAEGYPHVLTVYVKARVIDKASYAEVAVASGSAQTIMKVGDWLIPEKTQLADVALTLSTGRASTSQGPAAAVPTASSPTNTPIPTAISPVAGPTPAQSSSGDSNTPKVVLGAGVNLRAGPGTNFGVIAKTQVGGEYPIVAQTDDWWLVCCAQEQNVWVKKSVATTKGDVNNISEYTTLDSCGTVVVFRRWSGAIWFGHVAYAIFTKDRTLYGSVDNVGDDDRWTVVESGYQWPKVFDRMAQEGYGDAAISFMREGCDFAAAEAMTKKVNAQKYELLGRNCANAAYDVLSAFGVDYMPMLQAFPAPNDWFDNGLEGAYGQYWNVSVADYTQQVIIAQPAADTSASPTPTHQPQSDSQNSSNTVSPGLITGFEKWGTWQRGDESYGSFVQSAEQKYSGNSSGKFTFDLPANRQNFVVYRQSIPIPGKPDGLTMWVYGDGSGVFLNVWLQDAKGQRWQFGFGRVNHIGWQQMTAPFDLNAGWPNGPVGEKQVSNVINYPLSLFALIVDGDDSYSNAGTVYLDDLAAAQGVLASQSAASPSSQIANPSPVAAAIPQTPANINLRADNNTIAAGTCTTVRWDVDNVREVYFGEHGSGGAGVTGHSSQQVCPASAQSYDLRVLLADGSQQISTIAISVTTGAAEAPQYSIWADQTEIDAGECVNVHWHAENVRELYFGVDGYDAQGVTGDGSQNVCPDETTRYMLRVVLNNGSEEYPTVTITVDGNLAADQSPADQSGNGNQASLFIKANPSTIHADECSTISWNSENVAKVEFGERGKTLAQVDLDGSQSVCPRATTEYVVVGTRASGSQGETSVQVIVEGAPQPPVGQEAELCGAYVVVIEESDEDIETESFMGLSTGTLTFASGVALFAPDGGGNYLALGSGVKSYFNSITSGKRYCVTGAATVGIDSFTVAGHVVDERLESLSSIRPDD